MEKSKYSHILIAREYQICIPVSDVEIKENGDIRIIPACDVVGNISQNLEMISTAPFQFKKDEEFIFDGRIYRTEEIQEVWGMKDSNCLAIVAIEVNGGGNIK